jgi:hypothetical protein
VWSYGLTVKPDLHPGLTKSTTYRRFDLPAYSIKLDSAWESATSAANDARVSTRVRNAVIDLVKVAARPLIGYDKPQYGNKAIDGRNAS